MSSLYPLSGLIHCLAYRQLIFIFCTLDNEYRPHNEYRLDNEYRLGNKYMLNSEYRPDNEYWLDKEYRLDIECYKLS